MILLWIWRRYHRYQIIYIGCLPPKTPNWMLPFTLFFREAICRKVLQSRVLIGKKLRLLQSARAEAKAWKRLIWRCMKTSGVMSYYEILYVQTETSRKQWTYHITSSLLNYQQSRFGNLLQVYLRFSWASPAADQCLMAAGWWCYPMILPSQFLEGCNSEHM